MSRIPLIGRLVGIVIGVWRGPESRAKMLRMEQQLEAIPSVLVGLQSANRRLERRLSSLVGAKIMDRPSPSEAMIDAGVIELDDSGASIPMDKKRAVVAKIYRSMTDTAEQ